MSKVKLKHQAPLALARHQYLFLATRLPSIIEPVCPCIDETGALAENRQARLMACKKNPARAPDFFAAGRKRLLEHV